MPIILAPKKLSGATRLARYLNDFALTEEETATVAKYVNEKGLSHKSVCTLLTIILKHLGQDYSKLLDAMDSE